MTPPIIGVTTYQGKNEEGFPISALQRAYVDCLCQAGAVPILILTSLPYESLLPLLNRLDGILFTGGGDIAIDRFGGTLHPRINNVDPERDSIELSLLASSIKIIKPFLGICRGFQLINVGMGGTLFTDIEDQKPGAVKHDYYPDYPRNYLAHNIEVKKGTRLEKILGKTDISVNSLHHQGAKDIPVSLIQSAFAPDGLVEAVELPDHPFGIAVQWHPEWLTNQPSMRRLFRALVEAAN
ncbi:MAG: gamma-glutamyl-gamma-aminobutyrate hydrolase family protein [Anaerolineales bacterium]